MLHPNNKKPHLEILYNAENLSTWMCMDSQKIKRLGWKYYTML
jgi:hypothetical protein